MSYKVYTVESVGITVNHIAMFVETSASGGSFFHVIGTILAGMKFESKSGKQPDESGTFVPGSKVFIGTIDKNNFGHISTICQSIPPPGKQIRLNGTQIDPSRPLYRCGQWLEDVKERLINEGVLQP